MKKYLLIFVALCLFGCQSKEEKAQELIKQEMFRTLYDFDSYQPIETKVDSSFSSIYTDSRAIMYGIKAVGLYNKLTETTNLLTECTETMEKYLYEKSSYACDRYFEAKGKAERYSKIGDECTEQIEQAMDSIRSYYSEYKKKEFAGWRVTHRFRCRTKGDTPTIANYLYILDKDLKNIVYQEDLDDEEISNAKDFIKDILEEDSKSL